LSLVTWSLKQTISCNKCQYKYNEWHFGKGQGSIDVRHLLKFQLLQEWVWRTLDFVTVHMMGFQLLNRWDKQQKLKFISLDARNNLILIERHADNDNRCRQNIQITTTTGLHKHAQVVDYKVKNLWNAISQLGQVRVQKRLLLISAPRLGVCLYVCMSLCHGQTSILFCFSMESSHFWPSFLHVALYQTLFFDFWFRPSNAQNLQLHKIASCMTDRPEMYGPTRGFSGMADSMEPCKMLWGQPLLPWQLA